MPQQSECRRAGPPQPAAGEEAGRRHSHVLNPNPNRNSNHSGDASTSQSIKDSLTQPDTGHGAPSRTPSRTPDMAHPARHRTPDTARACASAVANRANRGSELRMCEVWPEITALITMSHQPIQ